MPIIRERTYWIKGAIGERTLIERDFIEKGWLLERLGLLKRRSLLEGGGGGCAY